jgi:hypothetical protein
MRRKTVESERDIAILALHYDEAKETIWTTMLFDDLHSSLATELTGLYLKALWGNQHPSANLVQSHQPWYSS